MVLAEALRGAGRDAPINQFIKHATIAVADEPTAAGVKLEILKVRRRR